MRHYTLFIAFNCFFTKEGYQNLLASLSLRAFGKVIRIYMRLASIVWKRNQKNFRIVQTRGLIYHLGLFINNQFITFSPGKMKKRWKHI